MTKLVSNGAILDMSDRADRLARIVSKANIASDYPLLKVVRIAGPTFGRLEGAVLTYIWHTLSCAHPDRVFPLSSDILTSFSSEILELPNRTPNGVLLMRRDTFQSFNLIHQALAGGMEAVGLLSCFSSLQIPCNVRIVSGASDLDADARSYSSAKMHTDVWNNEPISSILFNIPILGDPMAVDLRFFEPRVFPNELRKGLGDYTLGKVVTASAVEYPAKFEMGYMYISDSLSLHQTKRVRARLRVSLDFRGIAQELLADETADHSASHAIYVGPEAWRAGGSTTVLGSGEPLDAFQRRRKGEVVPREALSIFDVDKVSDERLNH